MTSVANRARSSLTHASRDCSEYIICVSRKIALVPYRVFPKALLLILASDIAFHSCARGEDVPSEQAFYPAPTPGEICVSRGERHNRVEMIGQDHDSIERKRALASSSTKGRAESRNVLDKRGRVSVGQGDRKEECAARDEVSPIPNHQRSL